MVTTKRAAAATAYECVVDAAAAGAAAADVTVAVAVAVLCWMSLLLQ